MSLGIITIALLERRIIHMTKLLRGTRAVAPVSITEDE